MKIYVLLIVVMFIPNRNSDSNAIESTPIAVVELFTSQGCSSCPAADKLLNEVINDADRADKPIFGLSFHVSYWNYLGWKDPYSNEDYTLRQRKYAAALHSDNVYTPQIIVNGQEEFVGSDRIKLKESIAHALVDPAVYTIAIMAMSRNKNKVVLSYALNKSPINKTLYAAVIKRHVENSVPSGENLGRLLKHDNVVAQLTSFQAMEKSEINLSLPDTISDGDAIVLFIQDTQSLKIVGASKTKIPSRSN